ncbi:hypothetical protein C5C20_08960 [Rathayibacter rathayi]|uniref:Two-component sensor histidine kinase n=1 Tax=Rathayibacter rathayi TaxID=33887 RepID=A0ABD6W8G3_RATRA|nr:hypothetical protein C5C04_07780 [Rathayibacter rathayi]PPF80057.1 hypothetical protein C5C14_07210 [Rathayibacter rathayi]PPG13314.1 hypothetical protein C5C11_07205 [Rathayibacter rathayi]PPG43079.1 hypothetical protein C5C20_08960 [Rathayibacter rathayi]PPH34783.1 hypothetical protein C5C28_08765 [Rathayibacter rathayi]
MRAIRTLSASAVLVLATALTLVGSWIPSLLERHWNDEVATLRLARLSPASRSPENRSSRSALRPPWRRARRRRARAALAGEDRIGQVQPEGEPDDVLAEAGFVAREQVQAPTVVLTLWERPEGS